MDFTVRLERSAKTWLMLAAFLSLYFLNVFWRPSIHFVRVGQPASTTTPVPLPPLAASAQRPPLNLTSLDAAWRLSNLVDRHDFRFLLNSRRCEPTPSVFLLIFVHSAPSNRDRRRAIRRTWGLGAAALTGETMHVVFLTGLAPDARAQADLEAESGEHGDIVQGNFLDSYRNLTYKHVMGLKWVAHFCRHALYVLKADDDVFVDTVQLVGQLQRLAPPPAGLMMCVLYHRAYVKRSHRSKWYVAVREYADDYYPSYCAGWAIVMSTDVVVNLYLESASVPYFWVDDVVVSGILARRLGIRHVPLNNRVPDSLEDFIRWMLDRQPDGRAEAPLFAMSEMDVAMVYSLWNLTMQYYGSRRK